MFHFVWLLGCAISVDEQIIGFKGIHVDNMRIFQKNEGGGFQVYALCYRGYTYNFFLRNEVVTKEYTSMGLSPFHARVFSLFLTLHNKFHEVHIDNIYKSAKFAHITYTHHNCVKVRGVYQTGGWGIPREVFQTELHGKKSVDQVR